MLPHLESKFEDFPQLSFLFLHCKLLSLIRDMDLATTIFIGAVILKMYLSKSHWALTMN